MSRFARLKNWPDCLKRMSIDELQRERAYWLERIKTLGHRQAKKGAADYAREVDKELDSRELDE
jgi:hypothetical protein